MTPEISPPILCFVCDKNCDFSHTTRKGKTCCFDCCKIIPFEWAKGTKPKGAHV